MTMPRRAPANIDVPDLASRLAAVEAAVQRIDAAILRVHAPDHAADLHFLSAIANQVGDRIFSARDLIDHAAIDPILRDALREVMQPRKIGKWLRRLAGHVVGPYRVECVKRDQGGQLWTVQVIDLHAHLHGGD